MEKELEDLKYRLEKFAEKYEVTVKAETTVAGRSTSGVLFISPKVRVTISKE